MERGKQKTISLKVAASVDRMLTRRAAESGAGKSDLVREALARYLLDDAKPTAGSFLEALDSDFALYRMHGRQVIPVRMPGEVRAGRRRPRA
jgi:hypothetical protein